MQSDSDFRNPQALSGLIPQLMRKLGLGKRYAGWMVVTRWQEIVGETMAERARAIAFDDGVLTVAVEDDSWRQELSMQLDTILKEIHSQSYGKAVKEIRLTRGDRRNRN